MHGSHKYVHFQALNYLINHLFGDVDAHDRVGLQFRHPGLDTPILIPFMRRDQLNAEVIMRRIEQVCCLEILLGN